MVFYTPEEPFPSQGSKKTDLVVKASERLWGTLGGTLGRLGGSKGEMQGHKKRGPMQRNCLFNKFGKIWGRLGGCKIDPKIDPKRGPKW